MRLRTVVVCVAVVVGACSSGDTDRAPSKTSAPSTEDPAVPPTVMLEGDADEMGDERDESVSDATTAIDATADRSAPSTFDTSDAAATGSDVSRAIVSLSPTATEMLYAIGAGAQVIAVDDASNHPPPAMEKQRGLSAFEPNVEAIAQLDPDLVVTDGANAGLLEQLDAVGIAHWEGPEAASFDDVYAQIEQLGAVTGRPAEAASVVKGIEVAIDVVKAGLPEFAEPVSFYHELDDTYRSITSRTFLGAVYAELGLVNIADGAVADSIYPQLDPEYIVEQDPDLIFVACTNTCGSKAADIANRENWGDLTAVVNGGVIEVDEDIASRWGPRLVDYLHMIGDALDTVARA